MTDHSSFVRRLACSSLIIALAFSQQAGATVVEFQTVLGNFTVNLFDETTPATVSNFLDYVNNGAYTDSVVHRSQPGFVVQGGGFNYDGSLPLNNIPQNPPVINEPELANVRGTIAMAKLGGNANSATNQWFISLADNTANLDAQNGGFTVFGVVTGNGMDVVDAIAALQRYDLGGAFTTIPLRDYNDTSVDPDADNFVLINAVIVTDTTVNTGANLLPPANTVNNAPAPTPTLPSTGGGGGGSLGIVGLLGLSFCWLRRRRIAGNHGWFDDPV